MGCCTQIKFPVISKDVHLKYPCHTMNFLKFHKRLHFLRGTISHQSFHSNKTDTFLSDAIHESLKNALLGSSEVFIGGTSLLIEAMHFGEPSFPYHESQYVWYVPSSRPLSCLLTVSRTFSVLLWKAVVTMMILVPANMWPLSNCSLEYQSQERMSNAFYNTSATRTAVLATHMPRTFRAYVHSGQQL